MRRGDIYRHFERPRAWRLATYHSAGVGKMLDVIMLAIGFGLFALAVGYAYACDRL